MSKHRRKTGICPNCHTILEANDNFCKNCGQENHELNVPFHHLVGEFLESIFHIDTKFWHTIKAIFTRPGKITNEFVEGKRASYMPPARFYIFTSFLFFLLVTFGADKFLSDSKSENLKGLFNLKASIDIDGKKLMFTNDEINRIINFKNDQLDSLLKASNIVVSEKNREGLLTGATNFITTIKAFQNYGNITIVQDSITKKLFEISKNTMDSIKNFNDQELHSFLAANKITPASYDFNDFKDNIVDFKGEDKIIDKNGDTTVTKNLFNGIPLKVLESSPKHPKPAQIDSILAANKIENTFIKRLTIKLYHRYKDFDYEQDSKEISHKFFKNMSYVMFILMPFVAIILLAIYYRSRKNYYEYFIFSIHIHSVLFLICSLELVLRILLKSNIQMPIISLIIMYFYLLFSLKNVYKQSWLKTITKFIFLNFSYGIVFFVFLVLALFWSMATLE